MAEEGEVGQALRKRVIATFVLAGLFLLWVGLLLVALGGRDVASVGRILAFTGSLFAAIVALVGGLGSKMTTDYQNLGLLVLSAALVVVSVSV